MHPPDLEPPAASDDGRALSPFFRVLTRTCRDILAQDTIPAPALSRNLTPSADDGADEDEEIERAAVTKANPRLTAHTVQSMLWGAVRGWTTLTANKSSVKAILRDIRTSEGGYGANPDLPPTAITHAQEGAGDGTAVVEKAALWVVDPRSLAEGMRSDLSE